MARGALHIVLLLVAALLPAHVALAASTVEIRHASDGTLRVVGQGWRPGEHLVVSLGRDRFTASVDLAGDFEVLTGLKGAQGPLAIRHADVLEMRMLPLEPRPVPPSPLALVLVEGLADSLRLIAISGGLALALSGANRLLRSRRYPPR